MQLTSLLFGSLFGMGGSHPHAMLPTSPSHEISDVDGSVWLVEALAGPSSLWNGAPVFARFQELPAPRQLYPRDSQDRGEMRIVGELYNQGFDRVEALVRRNGTFWRRVSQDLVYRSQKAPFSLTVGLAASLSDYRVQLRFFRGEESVLLADTPDVVCGDVYLVQGQSNASAPDIHDERLANTSQSPWIRAYGTDAPVASEVLKHQSWTFASGQRVSTHGMIGAWALRMAEVLVREHRVPVAVINGARSGTRIVDHLRDESDHDSLDTLYGRLLFRVREAGVADSARALLWYQGESDNWDPDHYAEDFDALYDAWHQDFPELERIYVVQIREGCAFQGEGVREFQRTVGDSYPDIGVMSTTALAGHDGCHFYYEGYRALGERMAQLVGRDLHGMTAAVPIDAPMIESARYTSPRRDEILLTFRDSAGPLVFEPGAEGDFVLDDGASVVAGATPANGIVVLKLDRTSVATTVNYEGHAFDGPWLRNQAGIGAMAFFRVPVGSFSSP